MDKARERAIRRQTMFWLLAFVVFLFFLWLLGDILLPFIAGMALAYFLDPVADLLERWGMGRLAALGAKVIGGWDDADAEMMLPDPIHKRACRQRIAWIGNPFGQT